MQHIRILVDLKPALDGYAGIPQETRLLFSTFKHLEQNFTVDGLLQHGSGVLPSDRVAEDGATPPHIRIMSGSRLVSALCMSATRTIVPGFSKAWQKYFFTQILRWQSFRDQPLHMGEFDSQPFEDFVWRHLFAKSVPVADKQRVTSSRFRVIGPSRRNLHDVGLAGFGRFIAPRYLQLDTGGYDFLLAQTPFPARVAAGTRLVIRYHDAVPILMPHTIGDRAFHQASHFKALQDNVASGALFACISRATEMDLLTLFPQAAGRTRVIHNIVSQDYRPSTEPQRRAWDIIANRLDNEHYRLVARPLETASTAGETDPGFLLMVSTLEPRKNHRLLLSAWERLRFGLQPGLKLVLVGGRGWDDEPLIEQMRPWMLRGELFHLSNVPSSELSILYRHATATICPSLAEGFDYSGVEAMSSGGLVIASDIAVHREVFEAGSAYFDPYSIEDAVEVIGRLLAPDAAEKRLALVKAGSEIAGRYRAESILPQWQDFFIEYAPEE